MKGNQHVAQNAGITVKSVTGYRKMYQLVMFLAVLRLRPNRQNLRILLVAPERKSKFAGCSHNDDVTGDEAFSDGRERISCSDIRRIDGVSILDDSMSRDASGTSPSHK